MAVIVLVVPHLLVVALHRVILIQIIANRVVNVIPVVIVALIVKIVNQVVVVAPNTTTIIVPLVETIVVNALLHPTIRPLRNHQIIDHRHLIVNVRITELVALVLATGVVTTIDHRTMFLLTIIVRLTPIVLLILVRTTIVLPITTVTENQKYR